MPGRRLGFSFFEFKLMELNVAKSTLFAAENDEMDYWKQKARLKWFHEGDANTATRVKVDMLMVFIILQLRLRG